VHAQPAAVTRRGVGGQGVVNAGGIIAEHFRAVFPDEERTVIL
jgi:hypothetical protein